MKIIDILLKDNIDVNLLKKKWNGTWLIAQWYDTYQIVKGWSKKSPNIRFKKTISKEEANRIIKALDLKRNPSSIFNHAVSYKHENN